MRVYAPRPAFWILATVAAVLCLTRPVEVRAEKRRVAVKSLDGPKYVRVRKRILRRLRRHVRLVSPKTDKFDAVLSGVVKKTRRGYKLELVVRAGDGSVVKEMTLGLRPSGRFMIPARRRIHRELLPAIQAIPIAGEPEPEPEPENEPENEEEKGKEKVAIPPLPLFQPRADREPQQEKEAEKKDDQAGRARAREPAPQRKERGKAARQRSAFSVSSGVSVTARSLRFDVDPDYSNRPRPYSGYFALGHVEGDLFPLELSSTPFLRDLGLTFQVGMTPPFYSRAAGIGGRFESRYEYWSAGGRYRFRLGGGTELGVNADYGKRAFHLKSPFGDDAMMPEIPGLPASVEYTTIGTGAGLELPLGRRLVSHLQARYLSVRDSGELEGASMFGAAEKSYGLGGVAGLELSFFGWMKLRTSLRYTRIAIFFLGQGDRNDIDGDGSADVHGAVDQYFGLYLTLGAEL